jgi:hypothetical protein
MLVLADLILHIWPVRSDTLINIIQEDGNSEIMGIVHKRTLYDLRGGFDDGDEVDIEIVDI